MTALLLALAALATLAHPRQFRDAICLGDARVRLHHEERAITFPDVDVTTFEVRSEGQRRWQAVNFGNGYALEPDGQGFGPVAFRKRGFVIRRVWLAGILPRTRGYLLSRLGRTAEGDDVSYLDDQSVLFFGPAFDLSRNDASFFDRVELNHTWCAAFWTKLQ